MEWVKLWKFWLTRILVKSDMAYDGKNAHSILLKREKFPKHFSIYNFYRFFLEFPTWNNPQNTRDPSVINWFFDVPNMGFKSQVGSLVLFPFRSNRHLIPRFTLTGRRIKKLMLLINDRYLGSWTRSGSVAVRVTRRI